MIDRTRILAYAQAVAREFHPEKIILFGSHAYGTPTEDSDVDLLVVMPHEGHPAYKAANSVLGGVAILGVSEAGGTAVGHVCETFWLNKSGEPARTKFRSCFQANS